jgi:hypothetical protein
MSDYSDPLGDNHAVSLGSIVVLVALLPKHANEINTVCRLNLYSAWRWLILCYRADFPAGQGEFATVCS